VSSHKNPDHVYKIYLEAANKLGYPTVDINGQIQSGIAIMQSTIGWDGIRSSTTNAFLVPNRKRQNLHIITSAFVTNRLIVTLLQVVLYLIELDKILLLRQIKK
jgi:choline dehydrogenase-like flavoprotein